MSPPHSGSYTYSHPMLEPTTEPIELSGAPVPAEEGETVEPLEHEALVGDEIKNEKLVEKLPTLASRGVTPFGENGEEVEHHKIVATEIVANPIAHHEPEPIVSCAWFVRAILCGVINAMRTIHVCLRTVLYIHISQYIASAMFDASSPYV